MKSISLFKEYSIYSQYVLVLGMTLKVIPKTNRRG